jgi:ribose transport system substrate-binding protein
MLSSQLAFGLTRASAHKIIVEISAMNATSLPAAARLIFGLFAVALVAGCGAGERPGTTGKGNASAGTSAKRPTIAFVTNQVASFWDIAAAGARDAARDLDVNVEVRFPSEATVTTQKQTVEDLLASGIDALAISPLDADNQVETLNEWARQVPLICHDSDSPKSDRLLFVGVDNYEGGREIGKMVREALPNGGNIIICIGRLQQDNARKRRQGVIDELLDRSHDSSRFDDPEQEVSGNGYRIVATITDGGAESVALQKAEDAINAYPDLNCFVGLFVYNPVACLNAVKKAGKTDILIAGFDEADDTLQGIRDGKVIGTCSQNPYQYGYKSVALLNEILKGNKDVIPETRYVPVEAIAVTKKNVDQFEADLKARLGNR